MKYVTVTAYLQIPVQILLFSYRYLFNSGEGTQRIAAEHKYVEIVYFDILFIPSAYLRNKSLTNLW